MWRNRHRREKAVAADFVAALNAHDFETLYALATPDFTYIDSWREGVTGRDTVMAAFRLLLDSDPDFAIEVERMDWRDPHVLMTGHINSRRFGMGRRAVWQVLVENGLVREYQAWAEGGPPPMSQILTSAKTADMTAHAAPGPLAD